MPLFKKKDKKEKKIDRTFAGYPDLAAIAPKERYVFHSDYFEIDNQVATVMSFFHKEGATDNFGVFWGINRIPSGLAEDISTVTFEQISRQTEGWLQAHQTKAEAVAASNEGAQSGMGTATSKGRAARKSYDLGAIAKELQDGAAYLKVHYRILVKAPTIEKLDHAIVAIERLYIDRFGTLEAAPYAGDQRRDLSELFAKNDKKLGHGFYFTSTEFAGSYSLVTHGLEDEAGEYVGFMVGDVNNSAVLFNVDGYKHHIVVTNENYHERMGRVRISDMWGSKISQSALIDNHKVVHIVMDDADLDKLGPKFATLTAKIDMNHGAVNMFEMFGDENDEMSIFPSQMQKLVLMAEQAYESTDADRSIIRGSLEEVATQFYIDRRMWHADAKNFREYLRVVGIPHDEVPRLQEFVAYLSTSYKKHLTAEAQDADRLHAADVLYLTFSNMLSNNGDLFNTVTDAAIDSVANGQRVIYDFSGLMLRGKGVAMAQLVNIIGFACGNLHLGDTVIIHGSDLIDDSVKDYIVSQFNRLYDKGGRVVFLYNHTDKMLSDKKFCRFDQADYTIFGNMTETAVQMYQKELGQEIPPDLSRLITNKSENICYIRRDFDNVVFKQDLALGLMQTKDEKPKKRKRVVIKDR